MKLWTYSEAKTKFLEDSDNLDQTFILSNELIGYFNEGIKAIEAKILKLDEDYFLTSAYLPLVTGTSAYDYPINCYAYKLRHIMYASGTQIYSVAKFRRKDKFDNMAFSTQYGANDDYRWFHTNNSAGNAKINLIPAARETAILAPNVTTSTPMTVWYIRQAARIPRLGEYILQYDAVLQTTAIDATLNTITVAQTFVTGDTVKLTTTGTMPGGLVASTVYYAIASGTTLKLATTRILALAGTPIDITSTGSGTLYLSIAANQTIIDNTIIDIPEAIEFVIQYAKCRSYEKRTDPRLGGATETLTQLLGEALSTLTEAQPDDDNTVEPDLSSYDELS